MQMPKPDSFAVPCWGTPSVICWRGSSASPLCIDIIACYPTHPSLNHRRSSFSGRCFTTVEHSAAERHVGIVDICFQETFEDPSLLSFFPRISSSACAVILNTARKPGLKVHYHKINHIKCSRYPPALLTALATGFWVRSFQIFWY